MSMLARGSTSCRIPNRMFVSGEAETDIVAVVRTATQQLLKERGEREDKAAKERAAEELTVTHRSVASKPQVLSPYMRKATLATTEKAAEGIATAKTTKPHAEMKPVKKAFDNGSGTIGATPLPLPALLRSRLLLTRRRRRRRRLVLVGIKLAQSD